MPELVPVRYGRMAVSPFAFFRGAAAIMAGDLAQTPTSGIRVQSCGDAHLVNFGVFAAPDRRLVFDLNDFDETLPAPVRVGPQAAGREHRRSPRATTASPRPTSERSPGRRSGVPGGHRRVRRTCGFLDGLVRALDVDPLSCSGRPRKGQEVRPRAQDGRKAHRRTSLGSLGRFAEKVHGRFRIKPRAARHRRRAERAAPRRCAGAGRAGARASTSTTLSVERRIALGHYRLRRRRPQGLRRRVGRDRRLHGAAHGRAR